VIGYFLFGTSLDQIHVSKLVPTDHDASLANEKVLRTNTLVLHVSNQNASIRLKRFDTNGDRLVAGPIVVLLNPPPEKSCRVKRAF
jgi:hypothetical protein